MAYVAFRDIRENLYGKLKRQLKDPEGIVARGWNIDEVKTPSELSGLRLPVNLLAYKYCPTNRDLYLNKVKGIRQPPTWPSYQGRLVHGLMLDILKSVRNYASRPHNIAKIDLLKYAQKRGRTLIENATINIDQETAKFKLRPSQAKKKEFVNNLHRLVRMESEIVSAFVDYTIATNEDINLESEFSRIFAFQQEICLNAGPLGLTPSIKPDFIYKPGDMVIMGEIKTGELKEFHKIGVAAYAMAYEYEEEVPVNFGIILNVAFRNRNVPIYKGTEAFVISDEYRKAFLNLRDQKLNMLKDGIEPERVPDKGQCKDCPYIDCC